MKHFMARAAGALLLTLFATTLSAQTRTPWQGTFVKTDNVIDGKIFIDLPLPPPNTVLKLERIGIELTSNSNYFQFHRCQLEVANPVLTGSEYLLQQVTLILPKPIQFESSPVRRWGIYNQGLDLYVEQSPLRIRQKFRVACDAEAVSSGSPFTVTLVGYTVPKTNTLAH